VLRGRIWAVVKANAYGHGIERVLPALDAADGLALLDLAEAERARAAGWRKPILLLEGSLRRATSTWSTGCRSTPWCMTTARLRCWRRTERPAASPFTSR
jgi:alanine racemase